MEGETSKQTSKSRFREVWETPVGKVVILTAATVAVVGLLGCGFKVLAFTTNAFKDVKDAVKR